MEKKYCMECDEFAPDNIEVCRSCLTRAALTFIGQDGVDEYDAVKLLNDLQKAVNTIHGTKFRTTVTFRNHG
jgi:hypothetical protein